MSAFFYLFFYILLGLSFSIFLLSKLVQFSSVAQSCLTLCDSMNCTTPGLPVHYQFLESHPWSQWCHPMISSSVIPFFSCPQSFPASGSLQMNQLFSSGGQSIGVSASISVLPMNIQDWFPSGWTGWIWTELLAITKMWKQLKCPSADNWLKKWCHTHLCTQT